jgi:hypothetical protein
MGIKKLEMKQFLILFSLIPIISNAQLHIGFTGDSKTPFGFEVGAKKINLIVMVSNSKSNGYTPIAYGNNSVTRKTINSVAGISTGIKIYKELYTDLGILISSTSDVVNVSNVSKGSYSYDPNDGSPKKTDVGMIAGLSYYFDKIRLSTGINLYTSGIAFKYGISYRL